MTTEYKHQPFGLFGISRKEMEPTEECINVMPNSGVADVEWLRKTSYYCDEITYDNMNIKDDMLVNAWLKKQIELEHSLSKGDLSTMFDQWNSTSMGNGVYAYLHAPEGDMRCQLRNYLQAYIDWRKAHPEKQLRTLKDDGFKLVV